MVKNMLPRQGPGIPGQGTKIPHATEPGKKNPINEYDKNQ